MYKIHQMKTNSLGIGSRIRHPQFGAGVIVQVKPEEYVVTFMDHGMRDLDRDEPGLEIIDANDQDQDLVSLADIEVLLVNIIRKYSDIQERVELGNRWMGGKMVLQPADPSLKAKEVPIETFFNKIVMLRDRLRVLEQRINAHEKLTDEDKVNIQQYITRCYGSLTTFNVLFRYQTDQFTGEKVAKD